MALADEDLKIRARQVGMLMRAYRENFPLAPIHRRYECRGVLKG